MIQMSIYSHKAAGIAIGDTAGDRVYTNWLRSIGSHRRRRRHLRCIDRSALFVALTTDVHRLDIGGGWERAHCP